MDVLAHRILRFDRFELDLTRGCLRSGGRDLDLRPKAFKVLHHLVVNAGRLIAKEELQTAVWTGIAVSDDSLVQCIRQLRRALGDEAQRLIKTVSRRGYLLDAEVFDHDLTETAGAGALSAREADPLSAAPRAVLTHPQEAVADEASAGERKFATVLYADVKESLERFAERDPEAALTVFEAILKLMTRAVRRYDGTVSLVTTDGILALFGAPLAHEDHAVRACNAALQIREAVERYSREEHRGAAVPVRVRAGLTSGEVVIRPIDSGRQFESRAMGPTMHAAGRIGQRALPGQLLVSHETWRLAEGHVEVRALAPEAGRAADEAAFELLGTGPARTRFQARLARGLTRFVGRDAELEQLHRAGQLARRGHGQVVALVAEPGVGKSRLVHEFSRSHHLQEWLVLRGTAVSYGTTTSYLPVVTLLKDYFEIRDRDELRERREKITGKVLGLDRELEPTLPALLAVLDVPMDPSTAAGPAAAWQALAPAERRQRMLDAVKRLLVREARNQPLLVIFEDLQWVDGETQALLDNLVEGMGSARLLLLVNYRPEYRHGWAGKTYYGQMRLDALPAESAGQLLDVLLGGDPGLAPLKQRLNRRGNPFFLEETVRTLVETKGLEGSPGRYRLTRPVQAIQIPATVQVILAARIDRLAPADKRLLQSASVIGKDVPLALLQTVGELPDDALRAGLRRLQSAEFLYETELLPDLQISFKHALTHEVTYGGLLREHRRELHARIVEAIETLYPDRLGEHIERLAHHAVRGELREKAVDYQREAGLKAAARSALLDARSWFEQALGALEALPETRSTLEKGVEIRLELRPVLTLLGEFRRMRERLNEAEVLAQRLNDDRRRGQVCTFMTVGHFLLGELDEALVAANRALEIAGRLGDLRLRIAATTLLAHAHFMRGDYEPAIELASCSLAAAPASVHNRCVLIQSLAHLGRFVEAAELAREVIRLAEPTHHPYSIGYGHYAAGLFHLTKGDWAQARSALERAVSVWRGGNIVIMLPAAVASLAWLSAQLDEAGESLSRLREGEHLLLDRLIVNANTVAHHTLGRAALRLGRLDEARVLGERAVEYTRPYLGTAAWAQHLLGDVATHPDRFDAESGEAHYRQALALAEPRGMRPLIAHCHLGLGKLYRRTGEGERAREHLTTATTMYREMDMRFWLDQADAERQRLQADTITQTGNRRRSTPRAVPAEDERVIPIKPDRDVAAVMMAGHKDIAS